MAVSTFNPTTGEGAVDSGAQASWAAAKGLTSGTAQAQTTIQAWSVGVFVIDRGFEPFDTSSLPDNAVISAARFRFYRDDSLDTFANADTTTIELVVSSQADPLALANGDYDALTLSSKGSLALGSTSNGAYNDITISDFTIINKSGYTLLALVSGRDLSNSQPTGRNLLMWQKRDATNPPILEVTYTVPATGGGIQMTTNSRFWGS